MNDNRIERWRGRAALRKLTSVSSCRSCGWSSVMGSGHVGMRRTAEGIAGFSGVATCGRIWLCPVCNAKVMAQRALEIGAALTWATVEGVQVVWGSLTVRHNAESSLADLLRIQKAAWRHVVNSKFWRAHSATLQVDHDCVHACESGCERVFDTIDTGGRGRVGYIRAAEITIGDNGWHPHFHPVIFYRGTRGAAQSFADAVVALWVEGVHRAGGDAKIVDGQQLKVIKAGAAFDELAGYMTKALYEPTKLALEVVWSQGKKGRGHAHSTKSHWSLLAAVALRLADGAERWLDLEEAVHGHRMITWSRGLRGFVGLGKEIDDETLAAEELGTRDDTVCFLTSAGWGVVRESPELANLLLVVLASSGWDGLRLVLDDHGVEWVSLEEFADPTSAFNAAFAASF